MKKNNFFKTKIAEEVWKSKYKYQDETPIETMQRVAKSLASVEKDPEYWENIFFNTLLKTNISENGEIEIEGIKALPGGRINANIGTGYKSASLLNCYISGPVKNAQISYTRIAKNNILVPVQYNSPDTGDDLINICLTLLEQALTLGSEGGWGINFSFIRPRGSIVKGVGVEHPGVIKFMEVFDKMAEVIVAGNNDGYNAPLKNIMNEEQLERLSKIYRGPKKAMSRKGAMMAAMNIDHPDIEEFIIAKQKGKALTKFNMSVLITDEFVEAVKNDSDFTLQFEGTPYKVVKARDLYDLIMKSTYNRNEPGVLFYDNMQKNNPLAYLGNVNCTNPCVIGSTLILTTKGWITIKNLYENFDWGSLKIISRDKDSKLFNSELKEVLLTEKNAELYKVYFNNSEYIITNAKHKLYKENFDEIKIGDLYSEFKKTAVISGEGLVDIIKIEKLDYKEDVYDLTAIPNYNFFSLLNKEEFIINEPIIINDDFKLDYFSIVNTISGQKFAYELTEDDEIF